jgi:hypothetical protein
MSHQPQAQPATDAPSARTPLATLALVLTLTYTFVLGQLLVHVV